MKKLLLVICLMISTKAFAYDLFTHLWIAQQVLNDIVRQEKVEINGRQYLLDGKVLAALKTHQSSFRIGTLGPDVFPDPIVGQLTAHPGVKDGWKTDDWIQHMLKEAKTGPEIALAYGYACHAAMDVFAHTYVNQYAGDVFSVTDDELDVELRHFLLEKYIGLNLPQLYDPQGQKIAISGSLVSSPNRFLSRSFILNDQLEGQYSKSGVNAYHLIAMNSVYKGIKKAKQTNEQIIGIIATEYGKLLIRKQVMLLELENQIGFTKTTELSFRAAEKALSLKQEANKLIIAKLNVETQVIEEANNAVFQAQNLISQKTDALKDLNNLEFKLSNDVIGYRNELEKQTAKLHSIPRMISNEVTRRVREWDVLRWIWDTITETVYGINPVWQAQDRLVDQLKNLVSSTENKILTAKRDIIAAGITIQDQTERIQRESQRKLVAEANRLSYQGQLKVIEEEMKAAQFVYDQTKAAYDKAVELRDNLQAAYTDFLEKILGKAVELVQRYNLVSLYLQNWIGDVEKGSEAYIASGESFAKSILNKTGTGISSYAEWWKCWQPVFTGVPSEIPGAMCALDNFYNKINSELDKIVDDLGVLGWVIAPQKKLEDEVRKQLKPVMDKALTDISTIILGERFTTFFNLISQREQFTKGRMQQIFAQDKSSKNLLVMPDVFALVKSETGISGDGGPLDPAVFNTFHNSIVLSKLAILPTFSLNHLYTDYCGEVSTRYGRTLYQPAEDEAKFSLLVKAVSSIDGSYQWMGHSLPMHRQTGQDMVWLQGERRYGYSYCEGEGYGFRFWADRKARKKVFPVIFKGPLTGDLDRFALSNPYNGAFESCVEFPFPRAENRRCQQRSGDHRCSEGGFKRFLRKIFG